MLLAVKFPLLTSQMACLTVRIADLERLPGLSVPLSARILISFARQGNFFIFHGRRVFFFMCRQVPADVEERLMTVGLKKKVQRRTAKVETNSGNPVLSFETISALKV
ncbi:hypothetical protein RAM80_06670 [Pseudomonas sp. App30]|uniref:hypothetical protein n=1 Tax=Pseudomonas sp. App30 TaxID=3068990 RepID=UPI003A808F9E